jgi:uncharacterized protein (TIGR03067 family)
VQSLFGACLSAVNGRADLNIISWAGKQELIESPLRFRIYDVTFFWETGMTLRLCITFALVVSFSSAARSDDAKDAVSMEGTWLPSSTELGGKPLPENIRKSIKLVLKDGKYTLTLGQQLDRGTVKLDSSAKPKAMDITGGEGPNKGKKILAIYELDDDTLRICYDLGGKARPTEFKSPPATTQFLVTYKREKRP